MLPLLKFFINSLSDKVKDNPFFSIKREGPD